MNVRFRGLRRSRSDNHDGNYDGNYDEKILEFTSSSKNRKEIMDT